jgi:hypothetical protein
MSSGQKYKQARKTLSDLQFSSFIEFSPNKFTYTFRLDHQPYQNLQVGDIVSNSFDLVTFQQEIMSY